MATTYTANKNLAKPAHGDDIDTWDVPVNSNSDIVDACLGTVTTISITGVSDYTLSDTEYQATTIRVTGFLNSGNVTVKLPAGVSGQFTFINATSQTDSTSQLLIGWSSGGNTILIPQYNTQVLTGNGAVPAWYQAAPSFSGVPTTITTISLTSLADYTLTTLDVNSQVIVFTGTLANATVPVYLPTTISGQWTIINATTAAGTSSLLQLAWSAGGNTYDLNQNSTQILYADSSGPTWATSAPVAKEGITYITLNGGVGAVLITLTESQLRNKTIHISGTSASNVSLLQTPLNTYGTYTILNNWTGGNDSVAIAPGPPGGAGVYLTINQVNMVVYSESSDGSNRAWKYAAPATS